MIAMCLDDLEGALFEVPNQGDKVVYWKENGETEKKENAES